MRYRISQIKIDPLKVAALGGGIDRTLLMEQLKRTIQLEAGRVTGNKQRKAKAENISIVRESIDARKKPDVKLVYTADFDSDIKLPIGGRSPFTEAVVNEYLLESEPAEGVRPVIAGFGPSGMFAGLILAEAGFRPVILERGKPVDERIADVEKFWNDGDNPCPDPESNVQFGEGGAGTFSDGKLTTGIRDIRIRKVLQEFVEAGAPEEILYKHKPHIGTDKLRDVVKNIRYKIESLGGEVRFGEKLEDIVIEESRLEGAWITAAGNGVAAAGKYFLPADSLIMAMGHSARDTFRMLYNLGLDMKQKAFSIGVRIEHPQAMVDESQYGDPELAEILGPADYKLSCRCTGNAGSRGDLAAERGVYTFCMCPGGQVVNASTEPGTSVTNGMSSSARDGMYANSAVLVDVRTADFASAFKAGETEDLSEDGGGHEDILSPGHPLAGIEFQKKYERLAWENRTSGGMARTTYGAFSKSQATGGDNCGNLCVDPVRNSIPAFASEAILEAMPVFGRKLRGFDREDAVITAVESRSSSPVRILRDGNMEALAGGRPVHGIIPAGEGPGYAGGIMSAAVDGIRAAEMVIKSAKKCCSKQGEKI